MEYLSIRRREHNIPICAILTEHDRVVVTGPRRAPLAPASVSILCNILYQRAMRRAKITVYRRNTVTYTKDIACPAAAPSSIRAADITPISSFATCKVQIEPNRSADKNVKSLY